MNEDYRSTGGRPKCAAALVVQPHTFFNICSVTDVEASIDTAKDIDAK